VGTLGDLLRWFTTATNWQGTFGLPNRLVEHLLLSGAAVAIAFVAAFPLAFWLGHHRRGGAVALNAGNVARALPSLAVLLVSVQVLGLAEWPLVGSVPAMVALVALAIAPILTTTYVAVAEIPDEVRESATAMGMTGRQRARRVELPLALPLALSGVRTAAVQVVATATLAAQVGAGGLGRFIIDGIAVRDQAQVLAGAVAVALVALLIEGIFTIASRSLNARARR